MDPDTILDWLMVVAMASVIAYCICCAFYDLIVSAFKGCHELLKERRESNEVKWLKLQLRMAAIVEKSIWAIAESRKPDSDFETHAILSSNAAYKAVVKLTEHK